MDYYFHSCDSFSNLNSFVFYSFTSKSVVKKFKNSTIEDGKVQYFKSRRDLDLRKFLDIVEREIIFLSVTNEYIVTDYLELVKEYIINRKINVIFLILNPDSRHVDEMSRYFSIDEISLRQKIETVKRELIALRSKLQQNYQNLFHIQTYDYILKYSLIIIDHNDDGNNKFTSIKIEQYLFDNHVNSRPNRIVFLKNNVSYYGDYFEKYLELKREGNIRDIELI